VYRPSAACLAPLYPLVLLLAGCQGLPPVQGDSVHAKPSATLSETSPLEVVVAPIQNHAGSGVPVAMLRESFQKTLVQRRYSPLALPYVDRQVQNAAYRPGSLDEHAVLELTVEGWNATLWSAQNALEVKIQARLVDARNPGGSDLWTGKVDRRVDFGAQRQRYPSEELLLRQACHDIAGELLAALPMRDPSPARPPKD